MEETYFGKILEVLCKTDKAIQPGKMMSSNAIVYQGKSVYLLFQKEKNGIQVGEGR